VAQAESFRILTPRLVALVITLFHHQQPTLHVLPYESLCPIKFCMMSS
jgi:hypothetical protein